MKKAVYPFRFSSLICFLLGGFPLFLLAQRDPNEAKFIGKQIADIEVFDAQNNRYKISELLKDKPLLLSPVYTKCPSACSVITANLKEAVKKSKGYGDNYTILTFSFDYYDTPKDLKNFENRWKLDNENWRVVSADKESTDLLLASIDYEIIREKSGEYLHPNVVLIITPKQKISRFVYGVFPSARDIDMAVLEAKKEKSSLSLYEGFLLNCFKFDAENKMYVIDWAFVIQVCVGLFFVLTLTLFVIKDLFFRDLHFEQ